MAIILPILLLISLFGRVRSHTRTTTDTDEKPETNHQPQSDNDDVPSNIDTPIDSSTIEYVDFEEIKDNEH
ncbi:MAG: hypothetical protein IKM35_03400 [Bacteroidaceae bacterium]|nr:hypothetical protein [Bacteroidaceae bacterium]